MYIDATTCGRVAFLPCPHHSELCPFIATTTRMAPRSRPFLHTQVPSTQKYFAERADVPTHLKKSTDASLMTGVYVLLGLGGVMFTKGEGTTHQLAVELTRISALSNPFQAPLISSRARTSARSRASPARVSLIPAVSLL